MPDLAELVAPLWAHIHAARPIFVAGESLLHDPAVIPASRTAAMPGDYVVRLRRDPDSINSDHVGVVHINATRTRTIYAMRLYVGTDTTIVQPIEPPIELVPGDALSLMIRVVVTGGTMADEFDALAREINHLDPTEGWQEEAEADRRRNTENRVRRLEQDRSLRIDDT